MMFKVRMVGRGGWLLKVNIRGGGDMGLGMFCCLL